MRLVDAATLMLGAAPRAGTRRGARRSRARTETGRPLLIVDMTSHEREEYRQQMGHVWLGFSDEQIHRVLRAAGSRAS